MVDSHPYVHGKRVALVGDPDVLLGLISFLLEMGARPVHIVATNGDKKFKKAAEALLAASPFGADATVWIKKDMWHLRSLMFTEPVDLLLGPSNAKFLWRDTGTTFVRVGFPLFDRHHLHKRAIIGYRGAENLLTDIVNTVLDEMDRASIEQRVVRPGAVGEPTMSLSLDKLLEAGCQSDAKHKVCRSRGGESCAFDGAAIVLMPIADAAHVVHGPIVCAGNAWEGRGVHSTAGDFHRRGFTTDIGELDIVYGGEEKLAETVREVVAREHPKAVFVYATCVTGLIGEDLDAVCASLRPSCGCR